jgi:hypothetical protein
MIQHWMEHTCVGCGGAYRYTTRRTHLPQRRPKRWVRMRPCPTCGLYQPDMVAAVRARNHLLIGFGAAAVAGVLGLIGWAAHAPGSPEWGTTLWAGVVAVLALPAQLAVLFWNPNRNPRANREKANRLRQSGHLERLRRETPDLAKEEPPRPRLGWLHGFALGGLALGILPFVTPELVRLALGWPLNRDWYPAVVGPGDVSRVFYAESIQSVQGLWNGRAEAEVLNAPEVGLAQGRLEAATRRDTWGNVIHFDENQAKVGYSRPWAEVWIPDAPQLGGKELRVKVDLAATYPADRGNVFVNAQRAFTQTATVRLADTPGAGMVYASLCRGGTLGGAAWLVLMSLALALAARAFRHEAFPPRAVAEREEDEDEEYLRRHDRRRRRIRDDD